MEPGRARVPARYVHRDIREGVRVPLMNKRYRKFVEKCRGPKRARRLIVQCARRHGTIAAAG